MAEEATTTEETTTTTEEVKAPPEENLVGEQTRLRKKAEKQARDAEARVQELEDRDKTELEKAQKRAEEAETRAAELDSKTNKLERGSWVRSAAEKADFKDPDDAVVHADLSEIEDEREAERFVKGLASRKKHLVKDEEGPPQIGQVLKAGERTPVAKGDDPSAQFQQAEIQRAEGLAGALKKISESNRL